LRDTIDYCLTYTRFSDAIEGYNDTNQVTDFNNAKSTSGFVFMFSGTAVS